MANAMSGITHPIEPRLPIKVITVDLEALPPTVSVGPEYRGLWALGLKGKRPVGLVKRETNAAIVTGEELREAFTDFPTSPASVELTVPPVPPKITIVVCTTVQRQAELDRCLASLARLDYPNYEVVIVDNRPEQNPKLELTGARVVHEPVRGLSNARNRGLAEAHGEIIAYTDDDVTVSPDWLTSIASRLQHHPEEVGVTGLVMPMELQTEAQLALEEYYGGFGPRGFVPVSHRLRAPRQAGPFASVVVDAFDDAGHITQSFPLYAAGNLGPGGNMAFRTAALREVGGFDVALGAGTPACGGEDLVAFTQILWHGYRLGFEPAAIVYHKHREDMESLKRQLEGYGIGLTALALALIMDDPRHLGRMLRAVPSAAMMGAKLYFGRSRGNSEQALSPDLARFELRGTFGGPGAYLRGRRQAKRNRPAA
jgi:GT2 family glycosyltransferase